MASSTISPHSTFFITKKDPGLSAFSSSSPSPFSIPKCKKSISKKIVSVMAPQQSERRPATTGSVKTALTMTEKIFARASEKPQLIPGENVWVNVDILMTHDVCGPGSIGIFKKEFGQDAKVWDREKVVIIPDHYIFTKDERANRNVDILRDFCNEQNIKYFYDIKDLGNFKANPDYKGVCHVALAQEGHCRPGEVLLGTDSHTCTAGAFGQFATGIGNTDAGFVLGTGKLLLKVPPTLRFVMDGEMPDYLQAKDLILQIIGEISVAGATYKSMEFVGSTVESLTMEERMTLCNMVVEAGGKNGVVPADSTTFKYLEDKTTLPYEPVYSDAQARFLSEYRFDISKLEPLVAKPHSPDNRALARECRDVKIDRVYIGSCTGGKTEDFMAVAKVFLASGKKVKVPTFLVPATQKVWMDVYTLPVPGSGGKTCAQIFEEAGCDTPASPSCGACLGGPKDTHARMNEPMVCVSTTNRNFPGRMGHKEGQIYLASPYTAAASNTKFPLSLSLCTSISITMERGGFACGFGFSRCCCLLLILVCVNGRSDKEVRERFYGNLVNSSAPDNGEGSIAKMFDRVLEKEFSDNDQPEGSDGSSFNNSVADQQAVLETVAKITHEKGKKNDTQVANGSRPFQLQDVFSLENEESEDMATLIDKKDNVFVMSNKKSKYPILQVDLRLISDLVVAIVSAAIGGIIFSCLGQPVIVGYLLAGSIIGPGGLNFISEMVQVETVAQFGVVFLLFALGLEFSLTKLKVVGPVAVLGGMLQIVIFMCLCGIIAALCGAKLSEGVFVGSFLSMSSTAVVVKFLIERNSSNSLHGQVTIGTLIFQDCAIGLLFALLPVLGGNSGALQGMISMGKLLLVLSVYLTAASFMSWSFVPRFLKLMIQLSSQTNELYQLAAVAFCLLSAWCSDKLGLSLELGSFVAGIMISTTDFAQHTLEQVEPIRNLFAALFLSSIGMLIHVHFLWNHVDILLASVILVIVVKTTIAAAVTKAFGYSIRTSFHVGVLLAQIGEFAFVLLSRASNLHLIEGKMYLLLLGTTALSLVTTPLLFKLIPNVMNLGILLQWFPSESSTPNKWFPSENGTPNEERVSMIEVRNRLL